MIHRLKEKIEDEIAIWDDIDKSCSNIDYSNNFNEEVLLNSSTLFEGFHRRVKSFEFDYDLNSVLKDFSFEKNNNNLYFKDNTLFIKYRGFLKCKLLWVDRNKVFVDLNGFSNIVNIEHNYVYSELNHGVYGYWFGEDGMDITYSRVAFLELYDKLVDTIGLFAANEFIVKLGIADSNGAFFALEGVIGEDCPFYCGIHFNVLYNNNKIKGKFKDYQIDKYSVSIKLKVDNKEVIVPIIQSICDNNDNQGWIVNLVEAVSIDAKKTKEVIFELFEVIRCKYKDSIADGILLDFYEGLAMSCPKLIDETDKEKYMELVKKVYPERYMHLFNQESIDLWEDCKNKFERNLKGFVKINKRS